MKKGLLCVSIVAACIVSISSCGKATENATNNASENSTEKVTATVTEYKTAQYSGTVTLSNFEDFERLFNFKRNASPEDIACVISDFCIYGQDNTGYKAKSKVDASVFFKENDIDDTEFSIQYSFNTSKGLTDITCYGIDDKSDFETLLLNKYGKSNSDDYIIFTNLLGEGTFKWWEGSDIYYEFPSK